MADQHEPADEGVCARPTPRRDAAGRFVAADGTSRARKRRGPAGGKKARTKPPKDWKHRFLARLAETSNVSAASDFAGIDSSLAYKTRRNEPSFNASWRGALLEGYENLELETLCRLREGELRSDERKFDIANALRLLKAHAEAVAAERARREDRDEEDILESLDRKIEAMRERAAANAAAAAELEDDAG